MWEETLDRCLGVLIVFNLMCSLWELKQMLKSLKTEIGTMEIIKAKRISDLKETFVPINNLQNIAAPFKPIR